MSPSCVGNKRIYLWIAGTPDETSMCPRGERDGERCECEGETFIDELVRRLEKEETRKRRARVNGAGVKKRKRDGGSERG